MIELLFFIIIINFVFALQYYHTFVNPATIFILGFLCAVLVSISYKNEWDMQSFHFNTFMVIAIGIMSFNIVCAIVQSSYPLTKRLYKKNMSFYSIDRNVLLILFIITLFVTIWEYKYKLQITRVDSISEALFMMDYEFKGGDQSFQLPIILRNLIYFRDVIVFYFFYILAKNVVLKHYKNIFYIIAICSVGFLGSYLTGSRGNSITLILFFIFVYSILRSKTSRQIKRFNIRRILVISLLTYVSSNLFVASTEWVGRDIGDVSSMDYFAIYCGAEVKNLDTYMNEKKFENKYWGEFTFSGLSSQGKQTIERIRMLHAFRDYKGHPLGNVYTIFQDFYQDFEYIGVIVLVGLIAFIMQVLYMKSLNTDIYKRTFDMYIFLYAYLSTTVAYSFFSDRFYGKLSWPFLKFLIELLIFSYIMEKYSSKRISNKSILLNT